MERYLGCESPGKVSIFLKFFVWTAAWVKILTSDNLRRNDHIIVDWCCTCWCSGETRNHRLIHCGAPIIFGCLEFSFVVFDVEHSKLWSIGAFWDSGAGAGLGNFWKSRVRVRRDSAIKKLLKIFLFIFST